MFRISAMNYYLFIIFYKFFIIIEATKPRTVNLALQTVLEFNGNNNSGDLRMIDRARDFLSELKNDIAVKQDRHHRGDINDFRHRVHTSGKIHKHKIMDIENPYKFTDFVKDTLEVLTTYDDDSLTKTVIAIADEIKKFNDESSNINKFLDTPQIRRTVSQNIDSLNHASAQDIRNKFNSIVYMIDMDLFTDRQKYLLNFINSLHGHESEEEFRNLINNLRQYGQKSKRADFSLTELLRNGIKALFDQYSQRISSTNIKAFWKYKGDYTDCTQYFCPMMYLNKEASEGFGKENNSSGISNSLTKIKPYKEQRNDKDGKIDSIIERIKKKEINEKVAELFDGIKQKKEKRKNTRHGIRQSKLTRNQKKNVDTERQNVDKPLALSDKLKEKIKKSGSRFITLYEEAITGKRKHSDRHKTTQMGVRIIKKRKKKPNRIFMRDSGPENDIVLYEHDAAIDVQRPRAVLSEEYHVKEKLFKPSVTSQIRIHKPIRKQRRKVLNNPSATSDEGLAIESFENVQPIRRIFKKDSDNYKNDTSVFSQNTTGGDILYRLTNLERELDVVKKQILEVNVRKKDTNRYDSSEDRESIESEIKDKNDKTTKIGVNETSIIKVTTLGINKYQLHLRARDDEFGNKLNNSIESNEVIPISNKTSGQIGKNNEIYEVKLNTTAMSFLKRLDEPKDSRKGFDNLLIIEKNSTAKRNNLDNKKEKTPTLKKIRNETKSKIYLDKNKDYRNTIHPASVTKTSLRTFTEHKLRDEFQILDKEKTKTPTFKTVESNPNLAKKTYLSDLDKFFNETDKIDFDDTLLKKMIQ